MFVSTRKVTNWDTLLPAALTAQTVIVCDPSGRLTVNEVLMPTPCRAPPSTDNSYREIPEVLSFPDQDIVTLPVVAVGGRAVTCRTGGVTLTRTSIGSTAILAAKSGDGAVVKRSPGEGVLVPDGSW